jgi:hypothetical protein
VSKRFLTFVKPPFIIMAKTLFEVFNEDFSKEARQAKNYPEAYDRAIANFETRHGFTPFGSYDSFRKKKERSRRK